MTAAWPNGNDNLWGVLVMKLGITLVLDSVFSRTRDEGRGRGRYSAFHPIRRPKLDRSALLHHRDATCFPALCLCLNLSSSNCERSWVPPRCSRRAKI